MTKLTQKIALSLASAFIAVQANAGTISYVGIPSTNSDAGSGISPDNAYTSAVDGGNTTGTDRVINGVTFTTLSGTGDTTTAGGITLNALNGSLNNGSGAAGSIQADGVLAAAMKDMTFNDGAADGSQQEIVIDPATLVAGKTYDLRVYVCNPSGQNRMVNLSFACDGQAPVDTGYFNEDDATTTGGGFADKNQVYYINYRYTWDGATTPGVTVTQKSGAAPFNLYALTNQEVKSAPGVASTDQAQPVGQEPVDQGEADQPVDSGGGTDVGVASTDFENCDCLNRHGRWVEVGRYGRCWQPTRVAVGWRPYTCGRWVHSNCGWTWCSDETEDEWGWATYHYGRWCRTESVGWCWVPGRVWAPAWVSWRHDRGGCGCVGWAPLPPEATCGVGIGISTWVDSTYNIGPTYYNFCRIERFGAPNLSTVCYPPQENVTIIRNTVNITNIVNNNTNIYVGGPNITNINQTIIKNGGQPIATNVLLRRNVAGGAVAGGKFSQLQGNTLTFAGPRITAAKNTAGFKPVAETIKTPKFDKGWNGVKNADGLKKTLAAESKGFTPMNHKAKLPADANFHPATIVGRLPGASPTPGGFHTKGPKNLTGGPGGQPSGIPAGKLHPGQKFQATNLPGATGVQGSPTSGGKFHPGQKLQTNTLPGVNATATPGGLTGQPSPTPGGKFHPGQKLKTNTLPGVSATPAPGGLTGLPSPTPGGKFHPGQKLKTNTLPGVNATPTPGGLTGQPSPTPGGKFHPGQKAKTNTLPGTTGVQGSPTPAGVTGVTGPLPTPTPNPGGKFGKGSKLKAVPGVTGATPTPAGGAAGATGAGAGTKHTKVHGLPSATPVQTLQKTTTGAGPLPTPVPTPAAGKHGKRTTLPTGVSPATGGGGGGVVATPTPVPKHRATGGGGGGQSIQNVQQQQQINAAKQQQAAAAAAARQQQATAAAAARQQQAAAAAAARQKAAAAAGGGGGGGARGGKGKPTPTPTPVR